MRISATTGRVLALPGFACLVLAAPAPATARAVDAHAAARSAAPLRSIGALPAQALAGSEFTIAARIANRAKRATRPRLVARLRKYKYASGGRVVYAKKLARVRAGKTRRFRVRLEVPEALAAGRYWLSVCVRARRRGLRRAGGASRLAAAPRQAATRLRSPVGYTRLRPARLAS